jgi:hypothetical protein
MSYAAHSRDFGALVSQQPSEGGTAPKKGGIVRHILDAFMETRQRGVDREITRFLAVRSGGTLTDGLEREISHRLLTSNWSVNASPYGDRRFP